MPAQECRSCGHGIYWCEKSPPELNDRGQVKTIPINADSVNDPKGNIEIWSEQIPAQGGTATLRAFYARYLKKGADPAPGHSRGISHFATCPQSGKWRS